MNRRWLTAALGVGLCAASAYFVLSRRSTPQQTTATKRNSAEPGYVNPVVCSGCHQEIAASYRLTGMGRSFHKLPAAGDPALAQTPVAFEHRVSDRHYTILQHNGQAYQRRHQIGFDGKETNILEKKIEYAIGSGNHARTYLSRAVTGELIELPISWYAEKGGSWNMSPGYDRAGQSDFRRPIPLQCMFCHNGYPGAGNVASLTSTSAAAFPERLPEGIDCQRCHGPGQAHVSAAGSGRASKDAIRRAIVNPAGLSRERQMDVCQQCHLETTSGMLPASIRRYEREVSSYRPGELLSDYALHFDRKNAEQEDRFEIAGAAYRLRQSACFKESQMTCTTCHNPHQIPRGRQAVQHYVAVCRSCHATAHNTPATTKIAVEDKCLDCHMPKRRTQDAVHVMMTDHRIQRQKPSGNPLAPLKEPDPDSNAYRGEVVPYYPGKLPTGPEAELYLAVAQVKDSSNLQSGVLQLQQAVEQWKPKRVEFVLELAQAYLKLGQYEAAIQSFNEALRLRADCLPATRGLATALLSAGKAAQAADAINTGLQRSLRDPILLANLGNAYIQMGRAESATEPLQQAISLNPDLADAQHLLGLAYLQQGNRAAAEERFREAIRLQPDLATAHNNLANLLAGAKQYPEARYHFEKAIAIDPRYTEAHHSYALLLELMSSYDKALLELQQTVRLDPAQFEAKNELGDLLAAKGMMQGAISAYREAIRLKPNFYQAHLSLATILARSGKQQEAQQHFEAASHSDLPEVRNPALEALKHVSLP